MLLNNRFMHRREVRELPREASLSLQKADLRVHAGALAEQGLHDVVPGARREARRPGESRLAVRGPRRAAAALAPVWPNFSAEEACRRVFQGRPVGVWHHGWSTYLSAGAHRSAGEGRAGHGC